MKKARRTHKYTKQLANKIKGYEDGYDPTDNDIPIHVYEEEEIEIRKLAEDLYKQLNNK